MMNKNLNWVQFSIFSQTMTMETWLITYMHKFHYMFIEFVQVYKVFTLSVQGKCAKCTRVYKGTYHEGF